MNRCTFSIAALLLLSGTTACFPWWELGTPRQPETWREGDWGGPNERWSSPSAWAIETSTGTGAVGGGGEVCVVSTEAVQIARVAFSFGGQSAEVFPGPGATRGCASAEALGEGLGTLDVSVAAPSSAGTNLSLHNLLVDLSPPTASAGSQVIQGAGQGGNGELRIWVSDQWALAEVQVEFLQRTLIHTFPDGYPATIGIDWDQSLVRFSGADLPLGRGTARVTVIDKAGNQSLMLLALVVDGGAPQASFTAPAAESTVSGGFVIEMTGEDPEGEPFWFELSLGHVLIARAAGPSASVLLDTTEFAPGQQLFQLVAVDRAGNRSDPAILPLNVL